MTRKRAIKYLMGVAHFDRNTIQKAFADTHKKVPGSSNVQIAAILLENWEDAAIAAHNINFRAAVIVKRFNLEIYHEKELHENPAVRKRPLDDDGRNPFLTYSIDGRGHKVAISCCAFITGCIQSLIGSNAFWSFIALDMSGFSAFSFCLYMVIPPLDS